MKGFFLFDTKKHSLRLLLTAIVLVLLFSLCFSSIAFAEDDYGDTWEDFTQISENTIVSGSIEEGGDEDWFLFVTSEEGEYIIRCYGDTDTYGQLRNYNGTSVYEDDDSGEGTCFEITTHLPQGYAYFIMVRHYSSNDTGSYRIQVIPPSRDGVSNDEQEEENIGDDHGDTRNSATRINEGTYVSGIIEEGGDSDYFRFTATQSGQYVITSYGDTDTYGYLYNNNGSILHENDDGGDNCQFEITANLSQGSTYYVKVRHYSNSSTGSYRIQVIPPSRNEETDFDENSEDDHGNSTNTATNISVRTMIDGTIDYGSDVDVFRFQVSQTGDYIIRTYGETDTYGYLLNASGTSIEDNDDGGGNCQFEISRCLYSGDTYYVKVRHYSNEGTGDYRLRIYSDDDESADLQINLCQVQFNEETSKIEATIHISHELSNDTEFYLQILNDNGGALYIANDEFSKIDKINSLTYSRNWTPNELHLDDDANYRMRIRCTVSNIDLSDSYVDVYIPDINRDIVYFSQYDYSNVRYGSSTMNYTGCGPTSAAMVLSTLYGYSEEYTPPALAQFSLDNGAYISGLGTSGPKFFEEIEEKMGCSSNMVWNVDLVVEALSEGHLVVQSTQNYEDGTRSLFGSHYVLLGKISEDKQTITVYDSAQTRDRWYNGVDFNSNNTGIYDVPVEVIREQPIVGFWIFE